MYIQISHFNNGNNINNMYYVLRYMNKDEINNIFIFLIFRLTLSSSCLVLSYDYVYGCVCVCASSPCLHGVSFLSFMFICLLPWNFTHNVYLCCWLPSISIHANAIQCTFNTQFSLFSIFPLKIEIYGFVVV